MNHFFKRLFKRGGVRCKTSASAAADNEIRGRAGRRSWTIKPPIHKFQVHGWLKMIGHGPALTSNVNKGKKKNDKKKNTHLSAGQLFGRFNQGYGGGEQTDFQTR